MNVMTTDETVEVFRARLRDAHRVAEGHPLMAIALPRWVAMTGTARAFADYRWAVERAESLKPKSKGVILTLASACWVAGQDAMRQRHEPMPDICQDHFMDLVNEAARHASYRQITAALEALVPERQVTSSSLPGSPVEPSLGGSGASGGLPPV